MRPIRRPGRFGPVRAVLLVALLTYCAVQLLARDACLERGGVTTPFYCATPEGEVLTLVAIVGVPTVLACAAAATAGVGAIMVLVAALRRRARDR